MSELGRKVGLAARKALEDPENLSRILRSVQLGYDPYLRLGPAGKEKAAELFHELYQGISYKDEKQKLLNTEVLLANLVSKRKKFFSISRNPNYWKKNQYRQTTSKTIELIDLMENTGFIEMHKGKGNEDPNLAYNTKIRATDKLLSYMQVLPEQVEYKPLLIEVRDSNSGKLLKYDENKQKIRRVKNILWIANEVNGNADIRHKNHELKTSLVAIYRDKTTLYGRLHTKGHHHYQGLSEAERAEITINGEPVVEWDFSGLHPYLLYAKEGIQLFGDPYMQVLSNPRFRDFLMECFLPLINVTGGWTKPRHGQKSYWRTARQNFISGVDQRLHEDKAIRTRARNQRRSLTKQELAQVRERKATRHALEDIGVTSGKKVLEAWIEAHRPISHYFCTDNMVGKKMMNLDAQIALDVVNHFARKGIPVLAIHDSFIVQQSYRDDLKQVMRWAYRKHTKAFSKNGKGFRIKIK